MKKKLDRAVLCLMLALALPAAAQEVKETKSAGWSQDDPPVWTLRSEKPPLQFQNETPEERMKRNGLTEDPGMDPDASAVWDRNGEKFVIARFPRMRAMYKGLRHGWVKPMPGVSSPAEIYYENDEFVWVWLEVPDESLAAVLSPNVREVFGYEVDPPDEEPAPEAAAPERKERKVARNQQYVKLSDEGRAYLTELKKEFAVTTPAPSGITVRFEDSSAGLPTRGSWRNGLDVADMNEDGLLDIIAPPQRGGRGFPIIFLGTAEGTWIPWQDARWPAGYNYGAVDAGDIDGDGHIDLALGAHLMRPIVLLGDGKGTFREASEGLPDRFPTRRVSLGDADGDGDLDLFVIHEGATVGSPLERGSRLRLFVNEGGAAQWREVEVAERGRQVGGDWMIVDDLNGDGRLDVAGSSVFFSGPDVVYLQNEGGWDAWGRGSLPFRSYYSALASGRFSRAKGSDLILSYRRAWPTDMIRPGDFEPPAARSVVGLERVSWDRRGRATRTPIVSWEGSKPVWGMASGDFDGDGHLDVVYVAMPPRRLEFLLGDGKGGFKAASVEGVELPNRTTYDVKAADVNGDGKDDLLLMFEKGDMASDGSVRVWLGRGREVARPAESIAPSPGVQYDDDRSPGDVYGVAP